MLASDARLKENIEKLGHTRAGFGYYAWDWTQHAKSIGADRYPNQGLIAQEVLKTRPAAVHTDPATGYLLVNYALIDAHLLTLGG